ncbi:MAG: dihydroorotate dehydrogenase electron transfer subunit [Deltaproteobacteria bacterium]|nr:dihydroorotate dehydrogenase electron transfer subunit [Deltaproteobacteria bacterium]
MAPEMRTRPVRRVVTHAADLKSFLLDRDMDPVPGQFALLWLPGVGEKPFSFSDVGDDFLEITVRAVGPFTRAMMGVVPGDLVGLRGPFGRGFRIGTGPALLAGGGCGIAPLRHLAGEMTRRGVDFEMVLGVRTAEELMFPDDFRAAGAHLMTEDGSLGTRGLVTDRLRELLSLGLHREVFASGPEGMLLAVRDLAEQHLLDWQLSFERYMKCGIGLCGHCAMDGTGIRMCVEGPVLSRSELRGVTDLGLPHRDATGARPRAMSRDRGTRC